MTPYEFFRATFGGLIGCGESPMVLPPEDNYELCAPVDAASEAAAAMIGAYVFVLRGKCTFVEKARVAQAAGARGLIVANLEPGLLRMPAGAQDARGLSLSVVMVGSKAGDVIHHAATSGVPLSATLVPSGEACVDDGYGGPGDYADAWGADADEWEVDARDESGGVASYAALQSGDVAAAGIVTVRPPPADGTNDFEFYTMDFGGLVLPGYRELAVAEPALACAPLADDRVRGKWAIVHRGTCPMIDKARHAQRVGAAGVILVNTGFNGPVRALGDDNWVSRCACSYFRCCVGGACSLHATPRPALPRRADGRAGAGGVGVAVDGRTARGGGRGGRLGDHLPARRAQERVGGAGGPGTVAGGQVRHGRGQHPHDAVAAGAHAPPRIGVGALGAPGGAARAGGPRGPRRAAGRGGDGPGGLHGGRDGRGRGGRGSGGAGEAGGVRGARARGGRHGHRAAGHQPVRRRHAQRGRGAHGRTPRRGPAVLAHQRRHVQR